MLWWLSTTTLALFTGGSFGPWEIAIVMGVGLLVFGRRLPDVGRNLGRGIVEFKKGLRGIKDEVDEPAALEAESDKPKLDAASSDQTVARAQQEPDKAEA